MNDDETLDHITENLSDDQVKELVAHRGGCQCCISPPCYAHSEPLTMAEAKHLGWWPEQAARTEKGAGK